jgi:hypothetical protein
MNDAAATANNAHCSRVFSLVVVTTFALCFRKACRFMKWLAILTKYRLVGAFHTPGDGLVLETRSTTQGALR